MRASDEKLPHVNSKTHADATAINPYLDGQSTAKHSGSYLNSPLSDKPLLEDTKVTHCLIIEEEHEMSQYFENHGVHVYRLTHRNADSGAANGLLTRIKDGHFVAVIIHMPIKKKDIKENRYHAHIRNLASWTRQAHINHIPILWIGPFGNAWNELEIRNLQNELKLYLTHFRFCNMQLSCRSLEPHQASGTCIVTLSSRKLKHAPCNCEKSIEHVLCWYEAKQHERRHAWRQFLSIKFGDMVALIVAYGILPRQRLVLDSGLNQQSALGLQATPDLFSVGANSVPADRAELDLSSAEADRANPTNPPDSIPELPMNSTPQKNQHELYLNNPKQVVNEPCPKTTNSVHQSTRAFPTESKERAKAKKLAGHIARARKHEVEEHYDDVGKDLSGLNSIMGDKDFIYLSADMICEDSDSDDSIDDDPHLDFGLSLIHI